MRRKLWTQHQKKILVAAIVLNSSVITAFFVGWAITTDVPLWLLAAEWALGLMVAVSGTFFTVKLLARLLRGFGC
jgi:hypothetical protein